ncbi:hypothetical protein JMUB5695_01670 [Mycobacterium heckeshornense]|uniref:DUF2742 domain-containing protein n=1 Tax=Mycobacterium heckeshornense TaxID=110505 RepID=UPI00194548AE|nr:DUF2742 domain-containing protein [Mycobacterium heckeshornense]BCQ07711.1 hypothetical protein JMUB5695_01132 [Mycobacterium heckeshornense]BCQ08245.1 hypothetical protein JMUB5695_01670 [Mycobacterium heckeshornense]
MTATRFDSRQVSWWSVYEYVESLVAQANCGPLPLAGTPAWCALADDDPTKLLAVAEAGVHWSLRIDALQEQSAEASKDIAAAADWPAIAAEITRLHAAEAAGTRIPRKAS